MALKYIILKLGGSIITRKNSSTPIFKASLVKEVGQEIKTVLNSNKNMRLILLHGAGSFGHPLAHKYQLNNNPLNAKRLEGAAKTITSMQVLSSRLSTVLHEIGLPVVPVQTSSVVKKDGSKITISNMELVDFIMNNNGIPLLGGDVVIDKDSYSHIVSADKLVPVFAQSYPSSKILLASDVAGVYPSFPPKNTDTVIPILHKNEIYNVTTNSKKVSNKKDVTGAMSGKLHELLTLRNQQAYIFDGHNPKNISDILKGNRRGTLVQL